MATLVQIAGPDLEILALGRIARWIEATATGSLAPYREIGLDISNIGDLSGAIIEIQMPVEKIDGQ